MSLTAKWIALYVFVWIIGTWLGSTYDGYYTAGTWAGSGTGGYSQSPKTTIEGLMQGSSSTERLPSVGNVSVVTSVTNWFSNAFKVLTWQWSFMKDFPMVQFLLTSFGAMGFLSMMMIVWNIIRGNVSW